MLRRACLFIALALNSAVISDLHSRVQHRTSGSSSNSSDYRVDSLNNSEHPVNTKYGSVNHELKNEVAKTFPAVSSKKYLIISQQTNEVLISSETSNDWNISETNKNFFSYKNKHQVTFQCFFEDNEKNIEKLKKWLDQFFLFRVCRKNELICEIQILYSANESVCAITLENDIWVLVSENFNKEVSKTIQHRTILAAPLDRNTTVCRIAIQTNIFQKPYSTAITIGKSIKKSGIFNVFKDSLYYLIFGKTSEEYRKHYVFKKLRTSTE
jgi:hypothetical protein